MGSCQSKKDGKTPSQIKKKPFQKQDDTKGEPSAGGDDEKFQRSGPLVNKKKVIVPFIDIHSPTFDPQLLEILAASYVGNLQLVTTLLQKFKVKDISAIVGYQITLSLGLGQNQKQITNTKNWNPLLLAIAGRQEEILKLFFQKVPSFHKINCLSKPFSQKNQEDKVFDHMKRIKREIYGMKIAILNQDAGIFKFIWNDNRLLWNFGHFIECLRYIIKTNWDQGLKILMASTTSKVIFMSINNIEDFVDAVDLIKIEIFNSESVNPRLAKKFKAYLFSRPYFIYCIFVEIASFTTRPDINYLNKCLVKLKQEDIQFMHKDIRELFSILDDTNALEDFRERFLVKFEERDSEILRYLRGLGRLFEKETSVDSQDHLVILEDLDLFAFQNITVNERTTNALIEAFSKGFVIMMDYSFNKSLNNIRSIIRQNNKFEVQNDITQLYVEFFAKHTENMDIFKKIYFYLVDLFQLSNFLEIFDNVIDSVSRSQVFDFILAEPKFVSLFNSSLELQKYLFISEIVEMTTKFKSAEVREILLQEPYQTYYTEILKGNKGDPYIKKTLGYLEFLEEEKERKKKEQKLGFQKTRGSGLLPVTIKRGEGGSPFSSKAYAEDKPADDKNKNQQKQVIEEEVKEGSKGKDQVKEQTKEQVSMPYMKKPTLNANNLLQVPTKVKKEDQVQTQSPKSIQQNSDQDKKEKKTRKRHNRINTNTDDKGFPHDQSSIQNMSQSQVFIQNQSNIFKKEEEAKKVSAGTGGLSKKHTVKEINDFVEDEDLHIVLDTKDVKLELKDIKLKDKAKQVDSNRGPKKQQTTKKIEEDHDIMSSEHSDDEHQMSQRIPKDVIGPRQSVRPDNIVSDNQNAAKISQENYQKLPGELIEAIKANDIRKVKFLIAKFSIKNVTWLKQTSPEWETKIRGKDFDVLSNNSRHTEKAKQNGPSYDTSQWNPVLHAIYYQRIEIVKLFLESYVINFTMAIRLPPVNEFTEYIIPGQKNNDPYGKGRYNFQMDSIGSANMSPDNPMSSNNGNGRYQYVYNSSDARVECFGIELAIRNRDIQTLMYLWNEQPGLWEEKHFAYVFDKILQEQWDIGIGCIFRSKTSHIIFKALNPEDKDNFLFSKIIDKITDSEYWEKDQNLELGNKMTQITDKQRSIVVQELQYNPYGKYACMKYPQLFQKYEVLESSLNRVTFDDIYDFVVARKENLRHLNEFLAELTKNPKATKNAVDRLKNIIAQANKIETNQRRLPNDPKQIVQLIKLGDVKRLKEFFEKEDNHLLLELLNQLQGHIDSDYQKMYQSNVKYIPTDETIQILLADNSTYEWNPLIFAIFYQKKEIVEYFCENKSVYIRNCLTTPFIIEVDEDAEELDEEKFIKEKTEMFGVIMCIMLNNKEIFRYLWKKCAFMWNDIHMVTIANFVFESQWIDGIKILFSSANTHQIFNAMNMYEKEKFLKFCDKSINKLNPSAIEVFRYHMSFDPYNIYYLPILATREDLEAWDKDEVSKELFIKNCQLNFDERSFAMLSKLSAHYVSEFISTAEGNNSEVIKNFARKLRRYIGQSGTQ